MLHWQQRAAALVWPGLQVAELCWGSLPARRQLKLPQDTYDLRQACRSTELSPVKFPRSLNSNSRQQTALPLQILDREILKPIVGSGFGALAAGPPLTLSNEQGRLNTTSSPINGALPTCSLLWSAITSFDVLMPLHQT